MRVVNASARDTKAVRDAVAWACSLFRVTRFVGTVTVSDGHGPAGNCYDGPPCDIEIVLGSGYPRNAVYKGLDGAPVVWLRDWREALISTLGHELCHVLQWQCARIMPEWHAEIDAEAWALLALHQWRRR